jgi:hypothetical protein
MPSIATLVADLDSGSIVGLGQMPDTSWTTVESEKRISDTCRVRNMYADVTLSISGTNRLTFAQATPGGGNGTYLYFCDDWATVTTLDQNHPVAVSGNFSGCLWKVFRTPTNNVFKCSHISRPGGIDNNAIVSLITNGYGVTHRWTTVHEVPSLGYIGVNGCTGVVMASQLLSNRIDSIALGINGMGQIVTKSAITST